MECAAVVEDETLRTAEALVKLGHQAVGVDAIERVIGGQRGAGHVERRARTRRSVRQVKSCNARRQRSECRRAPRAVDLEDRARPVTDEQGSTRGVGREREAAGNAQIGRKGLSRAVRYDAIDDALEAARDVET